MRLRTRPPLLTYLLHIPDSWDLTLLSGSVTRNR